MKSKGLLLAVLILFGTLSTVTNAAFGAEQLSIVTKWGTYSTVDGRFRYPNGIASDSEGNVYVADTGNNRIQKFSGNGTFVASWGSYGSADGKFRYPEGVAIDSTTGNVYVADTMNNRIQKFSGNGTFVASWGSYGSADGGFISPRDIATDSDGNVYVADTGNNRIQKFSGNGTFVAKEGTYGKKEGQLNHLSNIAIDSLGNIFVTDFGNHRVVRYIITELDNLTNTNHENGPFTKDPILKVEEAIGGLALPTNMVFLGPNDVIVLQKDIPTVQRIVNGSVLDTPLLKLDLGGRFEGCMCGIDVSKNNEGLTYVFLYYYILEPAGENPAGGYLYRYDLVDNKMANPKLLFFVPTLDTSIHMGGDVLVGLDNNVYLTIGDMDGSHKTQAQNFVNGTTVDGTSSIIRLTQDGQPVIDENSLGTEDPLNKYYAYGIRNSFGLDFDPLSGKLWDTENGPDFGDELNLVELGFNSGYNTVEGMSSSKGGFDPNQLEDFGGKGKYSDPEFEWFNTIGPTGLEFLKSDKLGKQYENDLFTADINNGNIYHFELNENRTGLMVNGSLADGVANNILEREQAVFSSGYLGISDLQTGPDGYLYVVSFVNGKVYRIVPNDTGVGGNE